MSKSPTPNYDPSIQALLASCEQDWGNPVDNRKNLVPYGIQPFDLALYGLDTINGELNLILGKEKNRKTTFVENVVINYMLLMRKKGLTPPFTVIDTLESGMHPKRYRDTLIANVATRVLLERGHTLRSSCPVCNAPNCREFGLSPEFLRYNTRTSEQNIAINTAMALLLDFPLYIYGANPQQGDTRNLASASTGKTSRWRWLVEEKGAKVFVIDHVQQYQFSQETSDYEKQLRAVGAIGDLVAQEYVVALLLSQVSLTSVRDAKSMNGKIGASGGQKAAQEANVVFSTTYSPGSGSMRIGVEESRKSPTFSISQPLEDVSGAFYGEPKFSSQTLD